jgi:ubiquinone/menaquinone biosynthesis C-methylase UbiE
MTGASSPAALPDALGRALDLLVPEARESADTASDQARRDGYLDLIGAGDLESTGAAQAMMRSSVVPAIYERWWRPAWGRIAKGVLGPGMKDEIRVARLLLGLGAGDGVLDVACGPGNFTREFARVVGPEGLAVGIDASRTMLARAVQDTRPGEVAYIRGDAINLPFRDESFDAVCCFAALNLFDDPFAALEHMVRVLTPGGRIALFTSCRGSSGPLRVADRLFAQPAGMRMFERDELTDALRAHGLREIHQRVTGLTQFVGARK